MGTIGGILTVDYLITFCVLLIKPIKYNTLVNLEQCEVYLIFPCTFGSANYGGRILCHVIDPGVDRAVLQTPC